MGLISIDGIILRKMMICGANNLTRHSQELDALNVFPVPDGDTGINMSATVQAAAREAEKLNTPNIYDIAKAASNGALRGARGNSGVILSQLFRGFAKGLEGKSVANADELAVALVESSKMAYRAVMKPKEGTILTIARALGDYAEQSKETDLEIGLKEVIKGATYVLDQTPEMLPELKQAGVVDSGGKGLIYFVEGALEGLLTTDNPVVETSSGQQSEMPGMGVAAAAFSTEDIKFAYCTEFLIDMETPIKASQEESLSKYLMSLGDSVVVVSDETIV
ncbi:MAG: DAK2 domain-containing protein, partial [Defluviitaleaceae bacterium]|nr:DAK2 domain-containing protein [Defluviitaleaceae bacterium]